jgi:FGGY-family pentulose kinase
MTQDNVFIGVDVGTGSARAGVFTATGQMLASASRDIQIWRPESDFVQQSSTDIWRRCCEVVKESLSQAGVEPSRVKGLGFDATCSLVVLGPEDEPVSASPDGDPEQNIIVWMDHRAIEQSERINRTNHEVLKYVGGKISPEMESPKLLWLKERMPESWNKAARFFDLPDFLVYRCTGSDTRSLCSTVCKWTYLGHEEPSSPDSVGRWDDSYWREIGLGELVDEKYERIGKRVRPMGEPVGSGLTEKAAAELGLEPGTAVGVSIIDAHAGGLGVLGAKLGDEKLEPQLMETRLALIGGTSSCHMAASRKPQFIDGIWGPYYSAMIPGMWLTEGGQSATGSLVDHVIFSHARSHELKEKAEQENKTVYELLNDRLEELGKQEKFPAALTKELHVLPYFHGNRSPRANPTLRGMISGLKLSGTLDDLALQYLATIQAIAYGARHIIEEMNRHEYRIDTIFACGGGTKNPVFLREHADIAGCRLVLPEEPEAVLLGGAILGAVAAGAYPDVLSAMAAMNTPGQVIEPAGGKVQDYHEKKYQVFKKMYEHQLEYRQIMNG